MKNLAQRLTFAYARFRLEWISNRPRAITVLILILGLAIEELVRNGLQLVHFSLFGIAIVFAIPEIVGHYFDKPEVVGKWFAHRVCFLSAQVSACLGLVVLLALVYKPSRVEGFTLTAGLPFLLEGALLGVFIRHLFAVIYMDDVLRGISTRSVQVWLYMILITHFVLFPTSQGQRVFSSVYTAGVAFGFLMHFGFRGFQHERARKPRLRQYMLETLRRNECKYYSIEIEAINLYLLHDYKKLLALIENAPKWTPILTIIYASVESGLGNYEKALNLVDAELMRCNPAEVLKVYLFLLRAVCLGELGDDPNKMFEALKQANIRKPCPLVKTTDALRNVESVWDAVTGNGSDNPRLHDAAIEIVEARSLAEIDQPDLPGYIVGELVPVNWTYYLDAGAYVSLANGNLRESKAILNDCIRSDPKYAPSYLHLAEWYLTLARQLKVGSESAARAMKIARFCLSIAIELEDKKVSLTKRRARKILERISVQ